MNELQQNIQNYFGILQEEELNAIGALFKLNTVEKGEYFVQEGRMCTKLSFIKSGLFRIHALKEGKEITQWISTEGYFITDLESLLFNKPAKWNIQALEQAELYTITKTDYNRIGSIVPQWHQLEKLFLGKCFAILEERIFTHLAMNAEERYQYYFEHNKELFNKVPLQYIASMLGMTPETFSRIRKKNLN